jgi:hypothetical protein
MQWFCRPRHRRHTGRLSSRPSAKCDTPCHPRACPEDPRFSGFGRSRQGGLVQRHVIHLRPARADGWVLGTRPRMTLGAVIPAKRDSAQSRDPGRRAPAVVLAPGSRLSLRSAGMTAAARSCDTFCHPRACPEDPRFSGFGRSRQGGLVQRHVIHLRLARADEWVLGIPAFAGTGTAQDAPGADDRARFRHNLRRQIR